ncbi:type 1 glutamine amidotransferase domain-containing protein [Pseudosporangium ferrugineum]|uniref:Putative intracellular protease/amidase n=1 Tax=Pseudosporangium ferrugineum TaxID=439699 RepID=A0A2T0SAK6_9ACTN|nr:type 1 glutamine amidotransferase domain-containing protein [Pseudosporangium ferrugineum]PRY30457.1 putative intracellular protease/amidase [Pseudosporangium ferrugineum]
MSRILIVLSAADAWTQADGTSQPTGYWAEEFVVPHEAFVRAGHAVDVATPGGRPPTPDELSFSPDIAGTGTEHYARYLADLSGTLDAPLDLADVAADRYAAVVIPGGHGPMEDLAGDPAMGSVLNAAAAGGAVVAAVCHGPAALLSAVGPDGAWPFHGRRLTCLTNAEETAFGTAAKAPWLLETRLRECGGIMDAADNWAVHVVRDGNLITGQNPGSSAALAAAVLDALAAAAVLDARGAAVLDARGAAVLDARGE